MSGMQAFRNQVDTSSPLLLSLWCSALPLFSSFRAEAPFWVDCPLFTPKTPTVPMLPGEILESVLGNVSDQYICYHGRAR